MAIATQTQLILTHLEVLLDCRNKNLVYSQLSSTRIKAVNDLHTKKMVEDFMDEDGKTMIRITENGRNVLATLLTHMNNWSYTG